MNSQEHALVHALITHSSRGKDLQRFFSAESLTKGESTSSPPDFTHLLSQKGWCAHLHFSWFFDALRTLPPETRTLFISLLSQNQAKALAEHYHIDLETLKVSPFMRPFLMDEFKRKIEQGIEVTHEDFLPHSDLNILLKLQKKQLFNLIDLLGIYDLSADLRQIVDKELLHRIYAALSKDELNFLHYCAKQPIKWVSPKLDLHTWDGSKKRLRHMLHARGLSRLGKALHDEDASLKWHLMHHIDTGRAQVIEKVLLQRQDSALASHFKEQVLHIVKRYQP